MSEIRQPTRCGLFTPGHNPHWIQMKPAAEDSDNPPTPGSFLKCQNDGTVVIGLDSQELLFWSHEPLRIAEAAAASDAAVQYQPRWGLLWVPSTSGRYAFSIVSSQSQHVSCPAQSPTGLPEVLMESSGGFNISFNGLRHSLRVD